MSDTLNVVTSVAAEPWYISNAWVIVITLMTAAKAIVNLVPSDRPRAIFGILDKVITALVPDNLKDNGTDSGQAAE